MEYLVASGLVVVTIGFPVLMVRGLIQMWRDKGRAGTVSRSVAGALSEFDRVVKPSVEHVLVAKSSANKHENGIDGD